MISLGQRRFLAASLSCAAITAGAADAFAQQRRAPMPPIRHVFIIVLENQGFDTTFNAHSRAPYLADTLRRACPVPRQSHTPPRSRPGPLPPQHAGVAPRPNTH